MFLRIVNDFWWHNSDEEREEHIHDLCGIELINIDLIRHVYEIKGLEERYAICIEYFNQSMGRMHSAHETFTNKADMMERMRKITIILNGGMTNETV